MQIITVEELNSKLNNGDPLQLLDVREPVEHSEFNIGGTLLPLGHASSVSVWL